MVFWISIVLAATVLLPALLSLFRYRHVSSNNRWLLVLVWLGAVNEVTSLLTALILKSNAGTSNMYLLLETMVLLILFYRWAAISKKAAICLAFITTGLWCLDNFLFSNIQSFYGFYPLLYSMVMICLAVKLLLRNAAAELYNVFTNGRYVAGGALILYFAMKALTESFFVFDDGLSIQLQTNLVFITLITNAVTNILYVHAILCFSRKEEYLLEYS